MNETKAVKILKASAGSGKTFSLTMHYIILLFSGRNMHRKILAVTFTNKATAEMKERILYVLSGLAKGSTDSFILQYENGIRAAYPELSDLNVRQKAKEIFAAILHDYGRFSISTIDKFVQQVVRSFSFELGNEAGYRIEMNIRKVIDTLADMLHRSLDQKPELLKWIVDLAKAQIVSSKNWNYSKVLTSLARQIFSEGYWDFEQALYAQRNKQVFDEAFEQAQRICVDFEEKTHFYIQQIQSIWLASGVEESELVGKSRHYIPKLKAYDKRHLQKQIYEIERFWKYMDDLDQWLPKKSSNELQIRTLFEQVNPVLKDLFNHYAGNHADYYLSTLLLTDLYYLRLIEEMNTLLAEYRSKNRVLLISDANRLLDGITREHVDNLSFIWEKTGIRYTHFLIDEFQDTSFKQWANFLPLIQNAVAESSGQRTDHLIVGDVKQSIYRWRNGDWRLLYQEAEKGIGSAYVQHEVLEKNYRSAPNIIAFNNTVFRYGPQWLQKIINDTVLNEMGEAFYQNFWVATKHYDTIVEHAYEGAEQKVPDDIMLDRGMIDICVLPVENNAYRPKQAYQTALQQTADTLYRWIEEQKWYKASQIGILVRRNQHAIDIIRFLYQDLKKRDNPYAYQVISGDALRLDTNACIKLLINTLQLLMRVDTECDIYWMNCAQLYGQTHPEKQVAFDSNDWLDIRQLKNLLPREVVQARDKLVNLPLAEVVERLIHLYELGQDTPTGGEQLPYLFAFRDAVAQYTNTGDGSIHDFIKWWEEEHETLFLPGDDRGDVVQIMTIHKSKGLAFDVVMLPFLDWTLGSFLPDGDRVWTDVTHTVFSSFKSLPLNFGAKAMRNSVLAPAFYEEKLMRCMDSLNEVYVALTRARKHLYIHVIDEHKPVSSFLSGDIIRYALKSYEKATGTAFDFQNADQPIGANRNRLPEDHWHFTNYPQGNHLTTILNKATYHRGPDTVDKRTRTGVLAHYILSKVRKIGELDRVVSQMIVEGVMRTEEWPSIKPLVMATLNHPALQEMGRVLGEVVNERSIIDETGATYRPDRIFMKDDRAFIVDFKFTETRTVSHKEQVQLYKKLLLSMGYLSVKGYLFYGYENELMEV